MKTALSREWRRSAGWGGLTYRLARDMTVLDKIYLNPPSAALRRPCDVPQHLFWAVHCRQALKSKNLLKLNNTKAICKLWKLPWTLRVSEGERPMAWHCLSSLLWMSLIVRGGYEVWGGGVKSRHCSLKLITFLQSMKPEVIRELWTIRAIS